MTFDRDLKVAYSRHRNGRLEAASGGERAEHAQHLHQEHAQNGINKRLVRKSQVRLPQGRGVHASGAKGNGQLVGGVLPHRALSRE